MIHLFKIDLLSLNLSMISFSVAVFFNIFSKMSRKNISWVTSRIYGKTGPEHWRRYLSWDYGEKLPKMSFFLILIVSFITLEVLSLRNVGKCLAGSCFFFNYIFDFRYFYGCNNSFQSISYEKSQGTIFGGF